MAGRCLSFCWSRKPHTTPDMLLAADGYIFVCPENLGSMSGLMKEAFTDADTFGVQFGPSMPENHRALILAATFLIDFLYFEDRE